MSRSSARVLAAAVVAVLRYDRFDEVIEVCNQSRFGLQAGLFTQNLARVFQAWRQLEANYERVLAEPENLPARGAMLLGAHEAGMAIEQSMLGATHACANPLTARHRTPHGVAIAVMLPHVVRWNAETVGQRYADLLRITTQSAGLARSSSAEAAGDQLAARLDELAGTGEEAVASAHPFREPRVLSSLRAGWVTGRQTVLDDLERIIGGSGGAPHDRLRLPPDADTAAVTSAATTALAGWQQRAESPMTGHELAVAARIAVRSCEGILAELAHQRDGSRPAGNLEQASQP